MLECVKTTMITIRSGRNQTTFALKSFKKKEAFTELWKMRRWMNKQEDIGQVSQPQSSKHSTEQYTCYTSGGQWRGQMTVLGDTHSESSGELRGWWADVREDFPSLTFSTFWSVYIMTILMLGKNKPTYLKKK